MRDRKTPNERLAESLERLQQCAPGGIYRSGGLSQRDFKRVSQAGYLQEIIKGWYHLSNPMAPPGVTLWHGHYWGFLSAYLAERYGDDYCLAADTSLLVHSGLTAVPTEIVVVTAVASGNRLELPYGHGLVSYKDMQSLPSNPEIVNGLRVMPLPMALARSSEGFFRRQPLDAAALLQSIQDPSQILRELLDRGAPVYAGRLAGAFRRLGKEDFANRVLDTMRSAGYEVTENDPFESPVPTLGNLRMRSPYAARLRLLWETMRPAVLQHIPANTLKVLPTADYWERVEALQSFDAYHSLSIEGFRVDNALIEKVRSNAFDPAKLDEDRALADALAARGYWESFQRVRESLKEVLAGANAGEVARNHHSGWYRGLFEPAVRAGLLGSGDLAGYRNHQVYINGSQHIPLPAHAVTDAMETFFDLLAEEPEVFVRAVLGHFFFVFIHPYGDGNGRLARFLMNVMLAGKGLPWSVVHLEDRARYMSALETASTQGEITPFAKFIREQMEKTLRNDNPQSM